MIVIDLPGEPQGKERPRFGRGRVYTPASTRVYETALAWEARRVMGPRKPLDGPIEVIVAANMTGAVTGKPDADNILKSLDALNKIVWVDDAQIVKATILKRECTVPSLRIQVIELSSSSSPQQEASEAA